MSAETATVVAKEALIHGVSDKDAAFIMMSQNLETLDDALAMQKQVIHNKHLWLAKVSPIIKVPKV